MCSSHEWTPPCDTRPIKCNAVPCVLACSIAATSSVFLKNSPVSMARSMREMSMRTMRPPPMLRWPTSLLPTCPAPGARPLTPTSAPGPCRRLHHFQLEIDFLAAHHGIQVLLPKLAEEAPARVAVVEVDQVFKPRQLPQVQQGDATDSLSKARL